MSHLLVTIIQNNIETEVNIENLVEDSIQNSTILDKSTFVNDKDYSKYINWLAAQTIKRGLDKSRITDLVSSSTHQFYANTYWILFKDESMNKIVEIIPKLSEDNATYIITHYIIEKLSDTPSRFGPDGLDINLTKQFFDKLRLIKFDITLFLISVEHMQTFSVKINGIIHDKDDELLICTLLNIAFDIVNINKLKDGIRSNNKLRVIDCINNIILDQV